VHVPDLILWTRAGEWQIGALDLDGTALGALLGGGF
jgi:hypothetical protein